MLGNRVGVLGFGPRAGGWAVSVLGVRAEARRGVVQAGRGLCICCSKCNKVHFSLTVYIYIFKLPITCL